MKLRQLAQKIIGSITPFRSTRRSELSRQLRLQYPLAPENAPKFAADMVSPAAEISGAALDFSVASINAVDNIIEDMRNDGCTPDQIGETLFGFGCYVGEVIIRNAGGKWIDVADSPIVTALGCPLIIQIGEEDYCNPIGKVFKRLENGEVDSLQFFYQVLVARR